MEKQLQLSRFKVLSGSVLKLIACISMFADHIAKFYLSQFPWVKAELFSIAGRSINLFQLMTMFGRFAFPIFVFLLIEGFHKTHDRKKYGLSIFILALISEIPYNLMLNHSLLYMRQSVMFTLLLGYLAMCSLEYFKNKPVISMVLLLVMFLVSRYMQADYKTAGFLFILLMYGLRKERVVQCLVSAVLLPMKSMVFLALLLTGMYNGERGFIKTPVLKYCFYAFYPVHMIVIYLLARYC